MTDDFDRPLWRRLVANRFVVVLGAIALAIVGWNAYVASHSGGHVTGRVTDAAGEPVAGASVTLWVLNFTTYVEKARGVTDADGRFLLINRDSHNIQLAAEKAGVGRSRRVPVRLYFRAQDVELREPLVLVPTSQGGS
jgi:hypothetical protein